MSYYLKRNAGSTLKPGMRGFTLTEMLVSLAIATIITTVVVFNQSRYTDGVGVLNAADDTSIRISQAQAYSIGVRQLTPGSSKFDISYGLTFSILASGSNSVYLFFADRNDNKIYDGNWSCPVGGNSECLEEIGVVGNSSIDSLCFVRDGLTDVCNNVGRIDLS